MVRLAVFGGTGPTGRLVVQQALARGHSVTALVRNVDKLKDLTDDKLQVFEADVFDPASFQERLVGHDAVLSCLGYTQTMFPKRPLTFYTSTMRSIVEAMDKANVNRIVCMTTWCTKDNPGQPFVIEWIMKPLFLGRFTKDMGEMEDFLQEREGVNVTVVKPAQLTNDVDPGDEIKVEVGQFVPYTFWRGVTGKAFLIPRAKVGRFMLDCLETTEYDNKLVSIA